MAALTRDRYLGMFSRDDRRDRRPCPYSFALLEPGVEGLHRFARVGFGLPGAFHVLYGLNSFVMVGAAIQFGHEPKVRPRAGQRKILLQFDERTCHLQNMQHGHNSGTFKGPPNQRCGNELPQEVRQGWNLAARDIVPLLAERESASVLHGQAAEEARLMLRRYYSTHVPIEIARTFITIAETRSFSRAGEKLGLSQPAISAQVKRLQTIVGGPVFEKQSTGGLNFTPRGQSALSLARKLLEINDQIVSLGGAQKGKQVVRVGISCELIEPFLLAWSQRQPEIGLQIQSSSSCEIAKGLSEGFLDVGILLGEQVAGDQTIEEWEEPLVWVRHPNFVASPGSSIPIIGWPGSCTDSHVERCFERQGVAYRIVFASPEHQARLAAASYCFGVVAMPERRVAPPLIVAGDFYLPKLLPIKASIAIRSGFSLAVVDEMKPVWADLAAKSDTVRRH
ncbi:MAG TPA: LysR family transcriptional regulator [Pseudolabrys sp.]|nr:LysR family transcriptional regulator [Pseudolabrys sp.]